MLVKLRPAVIANRCRVACRSASPHKEHGCRCRGNLFCGSITLYLEGLPDCQRPRKLTDRLLRAVTSSTTSYGVTLPIVGSPRNRVIEPTKLGSVLPEGSNHSFAVPIVNLGGRGLATNLTLYYNSRIWARHGNSITFGPVASWPAPGFSLSFGRLLTYGSSSALKYLYVAPDGTRHFLGTGGTASQTVTLRTTDGTQITYTGNATTGGTLFYTDKSSRYNADQQPAGPY